MSVGTVIVTYNSAHLLASCIRSLWANDVTDIIIVDNASTDNTVEVARGLGLSPIFLAKNHGFAAACNIGASLLNNDLILFLNPDALLTPKALMKAGRHFQNSASLGVVGLSLTATDGSVEIAGYGSEVTLAHLIRRQTISQPRITVPKVVGWVSAGALLIRRRAFVQVGGFDNQFFMYWEDVDLCKRLRMKKWNIIIEPNARVEHQRGASMSDLNKKTRLYDISADRYFRKHYATPIWLTQRLLRRLHRIRSPLVQ